MPHSKGSYFVHMKAFVLEGYGEEGWQQLLAALPEGERHTVDAALSISWVEMRTRIRVTRLLLEVLAAGDREVLRAFGRFEADRDLSTTQRFFLRMANPGYAIQKAGQYWRRFYDWGDLVVERRGNNYVIATVRESVVDDEVYCIQWMAYLLRVFELVGAKNIKVQHTHCKMRGDPHCVFEGTWSE